MSKVNIEMSKEQYETLVKMVFLGTWMVNSTKIELDEAFEDVRELVLSKYKAAGLEDKVVYEEQMGVYDLDINFETSLLDSYVDEYDEFSFWDKLIEKLAEKELTALYGPLEENLTEEQLEKRLELEEKIGRKLEETGITQLSFDE
ncbi:hypothetical protein [Halobacillus karajensis]|uniref:Uncharacterized protein n=1 Tax=Halobacillus karajensis TaxID=195088 RepID=A0A059NW78_9BACI|nr:hypothetical protein [Halobacillus karajensis]CDQ21162.1 hypothetical protein BN982_03527 [Halobacillus karajensis]CDQ24774.1 hypothetical protein BN983_03071 [Halobacillus karajensis]CDQ28866.1 hypothetical protein BN981_03183 [Halobacillus karajensis]